MSEPPDRVYVYALSRTPDAPTRYVGRTKNPDQRLSSHMSMAKAKVGELRVAEWLMSFRQRGETPSMRILEVVGRHCWRQAEKDWIAAFRDLGFDLLNTDAGGEGPPYGREVSDVTRRRQSEALSGRTMSQESCEKMSRAHKERLRNDPEARRELTERLREYWSKPENQGKRRQWALGRSRPERVKEKISDTLQGREFTDEHRRKISEAKSGTPKSSEHRRKLAEANRALTYDEAQEIRDRYEPYEVTQRELAAEFGVSRSVISNIVNGHGYERRDD